MDYNLDHIFGNVLEQFNDIVETGEKLIKKLKEDKENLDSQI